MQCLANSMCHNVTNAPKVKVTVILKQMYPHTTFGIPTSNNTEDMLQAQFFWNRGQRLRSQ